MGKYDLPFRVGQRVELRSFIEGYRCSWFRCKILGIRGKKDQQEYTLEYSDFPDEKIRWTKVYQCSPNNPRSKELMVRPCYPTIYRESQIPDTNAISEVVVIVVDVWKVGDLVDWIPDTYWSGKIVKVLRNGKVKVELPPPPVGEGSTHDALCKDLRPSLDWSIEHGWTVPAPVNGRCCARIIKPVNQDAGEESGVEAKAQALQPSDTSEQMEKQPVVATASVEIQMTGNNMESDVADDCSIGRISFSDSISSSHVKDASTTEIVSETTDGHNRCENGGPLKKMRIDGNGSVELMCTDSLETAVLELEKLLIQVKWMKGLLEFGMPVSNSTGTSWKFLEDGASATPK
ncbi:hypothetical protein FNV43_RR01504 [Rhamnella rubrinervis]|uniref:Agenet domain-containing protein n=1 Tax=Rhamnella rubrinervis TaxID=2594499 RepID=A0A8K0HQL5_9ROSA|nr:hypothetical protein FNV43_RR01504 [Rhamnella rubrinervis]